MVRITFCEQNHKHGTDKVIQKLKAEYPDADINVKPCTGHCGECSNGPFALIDDEVVSAETPEQLYESIIKSLR